jgi:glycosyltransferase involved in cell wall biosynthesis
MSEPRDRFRLQTEEPGLRPRGVRPQAEESGLRPRGFRLQAEESGLRPRGFRLQAEEPDTTARVRLACLTTSAACGGAETSLLTLLGELRRLEPAWEIVVIVPSRGPVIDRCRRIGVSVSIVPYPAALRRLGESGMGLDDQSRADRWRHIAPTIRAAALLPAYLLRLRRTFDMLDTTIVHSNGLKAHVLSALAKPANVRLVWHLHDYLQARPLTRAVLRRLVLRADAIVSNSESVRRDAASALGGRSGVRRVYNAVDLEAFRPDGPALDLAARAALPGDAGFVRVGLVGTFARWKGHEVFIDAIARMQSRASVRAYIIGDAVYDTSGSQWSRGELQARVGAAGLNGTIGFTGHIDEVPDALRSLDIVVHASTRPEPFGMVIAEAMAAGRAIVASSAGGAGELFEDGVSGLGHAPGDASQLAARLDALAGDAAWRSRLGAAARAAACERFAPRRMAAEFRRVYLG